MKTTVFVAACAMATCAFGEIMVKDGDTLAFLGDSITQFGQQNADGYVNLTIRALAAEGVRVKPVKAGISVSALKAYLETPHMKAFGPKVSGLRASGTFHVLEDVAR